MPGKDKYRYLMLSFFVLAACVAGCHCETGPLHINPDTEPGWELVLQDDFESPELDQSLWDTGYLWGRCWPPAYYTDNGNYEIQGGALRLIARREPVTGFCFDWDAEGNFTPYYEDFAYSSGMLYGREPFRYGYFECTFKVPEGKSFNAAFWLYGEKACEIDVFEILGSDTTDAQMTLHWKERDWLVGTRQWPKHVRREAPSFSEDWHTFGVLWEPDRLDWYLNGERVFQSAWTRYIRGRHIPDVDMHVILTLGIGGMDGDPNEETPFPAAFLVDRVRVYRTPATIIPSQS
ncbi:MAG: glycoside hydrolase family 16 protein [Candidatus Hydrogenedentes bacterium]|nr:glycoside hydrolase family 16 protein [Candidatus Hydrogenedentota bacterium]